ncbi:hypothetical protein [Marinicella sp. W31]
MTSFDPLKAIESGAFAAQKYVFTAHGKAHAAEILCCLQIAGT